MLVHFFWSGEGLHHQDFHLADVEEDAGTVAPGADEAVRRQRRSADQRPTGKSDRFSVSLNWKVYLFSFLYYPAFISKVFHFLPIPPVLEVVPYFFPGYLSTIPH